MTNDNKTIIRRLNISEQKKKKRKNCSMYTLLYTFCYLSELFETQHNVFYACTKNYVKNSNCR